MKIKRVFLPTQLEEDPIINLRRNIMKQANKVLFVILVVAINYHNQQ